MRRLLPAPPASPSLPSRTSRRDFLKAAGGGALGLSLMGSAGRGPGRLVDVVGDHGAAGDGVTDDTRAVAAAFDAARRGDGVYFPPGSYRLASWGTRTLGTDLVLLGDSARHTRILGPGAATDAFAVRASLEVRGLGFESWGEVFDFDGHAGVVDLLRMRDVEFGGVVRGVAWNRSSAGDYIDRIDVDGLRAIRLTGEAFEVQGYRTASLRNVHMDGVRSRGIRLGLNDPVRASSEWQHAEITHFDIRNVSGGDGSANAVQVYGRFALIGPGYVENVTNAARDDAEGIYTKVRHGRITGVRCLNAGHREGSIVTKGDARDSAAAPAAPPGRAMVIDGCHVVYEGRTEHAWGITVATADTLVTGCWVEGAAGPLYAVTDDAIDNVRFIDNGGLMGPHTTAGLQTRCHGTNQEYRGFRFAESAPLVAGHRRGILHRIEARGEGSQRHDARGVTYADNSFGPLTARGAGRRSYGIALVAFEKVSDVFAHGNHHHGVDHAYTWECVNDGSTAFGEIRRGHVHDERFTDVGGAVIHRNDATGFAYSDFHGAAVPGPGREDRPRTDPRRPPLGGATRRPHGSDPWA